MPEERDPRLLSLLGLCRKAGRLNSGETACEEAIRSGGARVVILSRDAAKNTRKKFTNRCSYYHVPLAVLDFDKEEIGHAIGRGSISCAAICEEGFAKQVLKYVKDGIERKE